MVYVSLCCRSCGSDAVCRNGPSNGKQRNHCRDSQCLRKTFYADYTYNGGKGDVKQSILQWSVDGAGIRVISRCLAVSPVTVLSELKKRSVPKLHQPRVFSMPLAHQDMHRKGRNVEFYGDKQHQIWLWWAIDREIGEVIAYWFGTREHHHLDKLLALLAPLKIGKEMEVLSIGTKTG